LSVWSNGWRIEQNAKQGKEDGAQMGQWELQDLKGEQLQARKTLCETSFTYTGKEVRRSSRRHISRPSPVPFSRSLLSDWPLLSFFPMHTHTQSLSPTMFIYTLKMEAELSSEAVVSTSYTVITHKTIWILVTLRASNVFIYANFS
jgi:hypothetical protein